MKRVENVNKINGEEKRESKTSPTRERRGVKDYGSSVKERNDREEKSREGKMPKTKQKTKGLRTWPSSALKRLVSRRRRRNARKVGLPPQKKKTSAVREKNKKRKRRNKRKERAANKQTQRRQKSQDKQQGKSLGGTERPGLRSYDT